MIKEEEIRELIADMVEIVEKRCGKGIGIKQLAFTLAATDKKDDPNTCNQILIKVSDNKIEYTQLMPYLPFETKEQQEKREKEEDAKK